MVLLSPLQKQSHISILTSSDHSTVYCARPQRSIIHRISILPIADIMVFIPQKSPQFEGKLTLPRALGRHPIAYSPGQSILIRNGFRTQFKARGWKRYSVRGLGKQLSHSSEYTSFIKVTLTHLLKKCLQDNNGYNGYPVSTAKKSNQGTPPQNM